MPGAPIEPINPFGQISVSALRQTSRIASGQELTQGSPETFSFSESGTGLQFGDLRPGRILIKVTSNTNDAYAWTQQMDDGQGGIVDDPNGMNGTENDVPAYEITGANDVGANSVVEAWPADDGYSLLFRKPGGGSNLFVTNANGSVSGYPDTLIINGPLTLIDNGNGAFTIGLQNLTIDFDCANGTASASWG
jgi:hypothetical protein